MSIIRIESFGGEAPSTSGQALPGDAAQRNVNLYSGTREFRPLLADKDTGVAAGAGAKTIYRAQRHTSGYNGVANETLHWRTSGKELSFVKGQVNDDATERTYVTTSDASDVPRAFNIDTPTSTPTTAMRKLGVPAPATVAAVVAQGKSFTSEDAPAAIKEIAKVLRDAIIECTVDPLKDVDGQKKARYTGYVPSNGVPKAARLVPRAGPKSNYFMGPTEEIAAHLPAPYRDMHWRLHALRPVQEMRDIFGAQGAIDLGLVFGSMAMVSIDALPFCMTPEKPDAATGKYLLETRIRAIKNPKDNKPLFDDKAVVNLLHVLIDGSRMQTRIPDLLSQLDACIKEFSQLTLETKKADLLTATAVAPVQPAAPTTAQWRTVHILVNGAATPKQLETADWVAYRIALTNYNLDLATYTAQQAGNFGPAPVKPEQPTTAQTFAVVSGTAGMLGDLSFAQEDAPEWIYYRAALAKYEKDILTYNRKDGDYAGRQGALVTKVAALQAKAVNLSQQIEKKVMQIWQDEMTNLDNLENALVGGFGGAPALFGGLDADRVKETRFYVATHVSDWDEESAPSPVSEMIEPTQYDAVDLSLTAPPVGRFAVPPRMRIYRSNSGSAGAAFQFLVELAPGVLAYKDELKAAQLGEGLTTATWLEPPAKLVGLVGMPNGIMAGFFDNTVAFCDPYHPYAWPVEYQITTEHPIVGLAAFGQTLFVGTTGSPYFISGSDSASMSALKMDSNQSCSSRRSIVAVQGGVLFASPDGLCMADGRGVSVVTQGLFTREDWQALRPDTMIGAEHEGIYYLLYEGNGGGAFTFDFQNNRKLTRIADLRASALFVDRFSDALYYADAASGGIKRLHGGAVRRTGLWKSGRNPMPAHAAMGWAQVEGFPSEQDPVLLRLYGDNYFIDWRGQVYEAVGGKWRRRSDGMLFTPGTPAHDAVNYTVRFTDCLPKRLPFGRWRDHEVEVESRARITSVTMVGSLEELKSA